MDKTEFLCMKLDHFPEDAITHYYNLREKVDDKDMVYVYAKKGMNGLPQVGLLVQKLRKTDWASMVTDRAVWHPNSGNMIGDPSASYWLPTILVSTRM